MRRLRERYPDELVVIGVHSAKFPAEKVTANIREAVMRHDIAHPVINDAAMEVWSDYGVRGWPSLALVTPEGRVSELMSGEINADYFGERHIDPVLQFYDYLGRVDRSPLTFDLSAEVEAAPQRPLNYPSKLLAAEDGRLFIADTGHHRILECRLNEDECCAHIERVFGSGETALVDGSAGEAAFNGPHGLSLSEDGATLYVADSENHAIRAIDLAEGGVRTLAGTGKKGGYMLRALDDPRQVSLRSPWDVWVEGPYLFIAMAGIHQIWVLINEAQLGPFAGNGREALVDGRREEASFNQPSGLVVAYGHILIADSEASAVRAIDLTREDDMRVFTLVGQGLFDYGDEDGRGDGARLQHPVGIDAGHELVFIADTYNNKIKQIDPTNGAVLTLAGTGKVGQADGAWAEASFYEPEGVSLRGRKLFVADTNNHLIRVVDLDQETVSTLTLTGLEKLHAPAEAPIEALQEPAAVARGEVTVTLSIALPVGYKLNRDAALTVQVRGDGLHTFAADAPFDVPVMVEDDGDLQLDLSIVYCEETDARLCLMHSNRLIVPMKVVENGESHIDLAYEVEG